jgi:hypothetical protein
MIRHILKQTVTCRRLNSWILLELAGVAFFLFLMTDFFWIRLKNYTEPTGFDIENTYVLKFKTLHPTAPDYADPGQSARTPAEDLFRIIDRIKLNPEIEHVSLSLHSSPYSMGGYWNSLRIDSARTPSIRCRQVTPSWFDVFRIRTADGKPLKIEETGYKQVILTKDVAELLCGDAAGANGREIHTDNDPEDPDRTARVTGVTGLLKRQEFFPYEGAYFEILPPSGFEQWMATNGNITQIDVCIRARPGSGPGFRDRFLSGMGDRLKENNLYVSSLIPSSRLRDGVVGKDIRENILPMTCVSAFVLVTVFLGVFASFQLRIRQRRSEIGIRMAMGAGKNRIRSHIVQESLLLMALATVPAFIAYLNMLHAGILDVWRLPLSAGRIAVTFAGAVVLLSAVVAGSALWPAGRAASIHPAEALKEE